MPNAQFTQDIPSILYFTSFCFILYIANVYTLINLICINIIYLSKFMVVVAQLVRALDCGSRGRGFESHHPPKKEFF